MNYIKKHKRSMIILIVSAAMMGIASDFQNILAETLFLFCALFTAFMFGWETRNDG